MKRAYMKESSRPVGASDDLVQSSACPTSPWCSTNSNRNAAVSLPNLNDSTALSQHLEEPATVELAG